MRSRTEGRSTESSKTINTPDRVEDGGFLAADVGAGSLADLDVEANASTHQVAAEEAASPRRVDRALQPLDREGVLSTHVDESLLASRRVGADRHRLDDRERVALHEHAVLEGAWLRLVRVADQVARPRRLPCDGLPLAAGGKGRSSTPRQLRVEHLPDHAFRPELERASQREVA